MVDAAKTIKYLIENFDKLELGWQQREALKQMLNVLKKEVTFNILQETFAGNKIDEQLEESSIKALNSLGIKSYIVGSE